jgi:hypothetical protein
MEEYRRTLGLSGRHAVIEGKKCDRCGYVVMDNDDDIWSVVGL